MSDQSSSGAMDTLRQNEEGIGECPPTIEISAVALEEGSACAIKEGSNGSETEEKPRKGSKDSDELKRQNEEGIGECPPTIEISAVALEEGSACAIKEGSNGSETEEKPRKGSKDSDELKRRPEEQDAVSQSNSGESALAMEEEAEHIQNTGIEGSETDKQMPNNDSRGSDEINSRPEEQDAVSQSNSGESALAMEEEAEHIQNTGIEGSETDKQMPNNDSKGSDEINSHPEEQDAVSQSNSGESALAMEEEAEHIQNTGIEGSETDKQMPNNDSKGSDEINSHPEEQDAVSQSNSGESALAMEEEAEHIQNTGIEGSETDKQMPNNDSKGSDEINSHPEEQDAVSQSNSGESALAMEEEAEHIQNTGIEGSETNKQMPNNDSKGSDEINSHPEEQDAVSQSNSGESALAMEEEAEHIQNTGIEGSETDKQMPNNDSKGSDEINRNTEEQVAGSQATIGMDVLVLEEDSHHIAEPGSEGTDSVEIISQNDSKGSDELSRNTEEQVAGSQATIGMDVLVLEEDSHHIAEPGSEGTDSVEIISQNDSKGSDELSRNTEEQVAGSQATIGMNVLVLEEGSHQIAEPGSEGTDSVEIISQNDSKGSDELSRNVELDNEQTSQDSDIQIIEPPVVKDQNGNLDENSTRQLPINREVSVSYLDDFYLAQLRNRGEHEAYFVDNVGAQTENGSVEVITLSDDGSVEEQKSDDSISDLSEIGTDSSDIEIECEFLVKQPVLAQPVCHGELSLNDLPPIEDLRIAVPEQECIKVGTISSIVNALVVVKALLNTPALDIGTVLFLNFGKDPLGLIFDVMGPVKEPYYAVRFNSEEHARSKGASEGIEVFCAPKTPHTSYVFMNKIMQQKGSDASWEHNNEPPLLCLDYSDDEEERNARKTLAQRKATNGDSAGLKRKRNEKNGADDSLGTNIPQTKKTVHSGQDVEPTGSNLSFVGQGCERRNTGPPYPGALMPVPASGFQPLSRPIRTALLRNPFLVSVSHPRSSDRMAIRPWPRVKLPQDSIPYLPMHFGQRMPRLMGRSHPPGHPPILRQSFHTFQHTMGNMRPSFEAFPPLGFMPRPGLLPTPSVPPQFSAAGADVRIPRPHVGSPLIALDPGVMNPYQGYPMRRRNPGFGTCMQSHGGQRDNQANSFPAIESTSTSQSNDSEKPSQSGPSSGSGQPLKIIEITSSTPPSGDKDEKPPGDKGGENPLEI